jgi:alginate O-acetyltransferase complex protein AlgI
MLFSSSIFLFLFLPFVLLVNFVLRRSRPWQNVFLLLASLLFYAWGEPWFVLVMLGSILLNFLLGLGIDRFRDRGHRAKLLVGLAVVVNMGLIFVFKYLNFIIREANAHLGLNLVQTHIVLPIGISFFTFQALSYVIDVYRRHGKAQTNPANVALYVALFPQLIAGPIVRYETVADQIENRVESVDHVFAGIMRFIQGLAKKVLLANTLAVVADRAFDSQPAALSVAMAWLGVLAYTFQIYFDFSGYSDMAIGLGKMMGFHFLENFNVPYISRSITEFWRRWHISLGTWFRDYLYIPLGGNRVSRPRVFLNLFVVWLLTGIWHGANWTFIVWGLYYFVFIAMEKALGVNDRSPAFPWARHAYTLIVVCLGWVLFRSPNIRHACQYLTVMAGRTPRGLIDADAVFYLRENVYFFICAAICSTPCGKWFSGLRLPYFVRVGMRILLAAFLLLASLSYVVKSGYNPFIYFNF